MHNSFFIITDSLEYHPDSKIQLYIVNKDTSSVYIWTCITLFLYGEKFESDHWELFSVPLCNGLVGPGIIEIPKEGVMDTGIYNGGSGKYRAYLHYSYERNFIENSAPIKYSNTFQIN